MKTSYLWNIILPELCDGCQKNMVSFRMPLCQTCINRIQFELPSTSITQLKVKEGISQNIYYLFNYSILHKELLKKAKIKSEKSTEKYIYHTLKLYQKYFKQQYIDYIIVVPSQRKFLQKLATKFFIRDLNIPQWHLLKQTHSKREQKNLSQKERNQYILEKIILSNKIIPITKQKLKSKHIFIFDDISTTGATLQHVDYLISELNISNLKLTYFALFSSHKQHD